MIDHGAFVARHLCLWHARGERPAPQESSSKGALWNPVHPSAEEIDERSVKTGNAHLSRATAKVHGRGVLVLSAQMTYGARRVQRAQLV